MPEVIHSVNLDSAQSIFFARELEKVKATTYDIRYPMLKATRLIPVSTDAGAGAESITYQQYDAVGMARIIANYANDLPRVDVVGKEFTAPVRSIGESYGYNLQEIRAAQMAGKPLQARKASAARKANDELVNRLAFNGDAKHGLGGLITNANIPRNSVANDGAGTSTEWADKSPGQILRDMNELVNGVITVTKGVETPTHLLMPINQWTQISTTRMADGTDTTVLGFFLKNSPSVNTVEWVQELEGAGAGGEDLMIAYTPDADKLTLEIPQPFEQLPVQEHGLEFEVPCHSRFGGVLVYYPLSLSIGEGI